MDEKFKTDMKPFMSVLKRMDVYEKVKVGCEAGKRKIMFDIYKNV